MADENADAKRQSILPLFIAVLLVPAALGSSLTIFNDGDVSWHIATGQWILDHHAIPHVDPFSLTWTGRPWVPIEWLSEVFYASAYRLGGYSGVSALVTAALVAVHAIVFLNAVRFVRAWPALGIVLLMDLALIPMTLARPHVLTWPLLAGWTVLMIRARERDRAPPLPAALIMTLWANLHGGFVFGLAIAAAFGLEAVVQAADRGRALRQWSIFGAACAVAVCINGNGFEGVLHPLRFTHLQILSIIDEWKPSDPNRTPFFFGALLLSLAITAWKRPQLGWTRWALISAFLILALTQQRQQGMLAILAAIVIPSGLAKRPQSPKVAERVVLAAGVLFLVGLRATMPMTLLENESNPWKLIASVPPGLRSQPVLNSYSMGGPLILSGIRPFIDGRGDMYGDDFVLSYYRVEQGDPAAFAAAVERWKLRWAIVGTKSKLVPFLDRQPDWRRIRQDKAGAIYVRRGS